MTQMKLREIESLKQRGPSSTARLIQLSHDEDEEVRFRAIEGLGTLPLTEDSRATIAEALTDPDSLVRIAVAEILGNWDSKHAEHLLAEAILDKDELVRTAAIVSLGSIGSKQSIWPLERRHRDQSYGSLERLSCAVALYVLGRSAYLASAMSFLEDESYQVRSAAANLLREFVSTKDIPRVLDKLRMSISTESTDAARSSMQAAIEDLGPR